MLEVADRLEERALAIEKDFEHMAPELWLNSPQRGATIALRAVAKEIREVLSG